MIQINEFNTLTTAFYILVNYEMKFAIHNYINSIHTCNYILAKLTYLLTKTFDNNNTADVDGKMLAACGTVGYA